jgi:predicted small lipoprotein YifL
VIGRRRGATVGTHRAVGAVLLSLALAGCGGVVPSALPPADGSAGPAPASVRPTIVPVPGHETYGFVPYWEMDDAIADHLATVELTTLALFSVTHRRDGSLDDTQTGWRRIDGPIGRAMINGAKERGTRVELVYTSFGAPKNRQFYADAAAQARWIDVLVGLVGDHGFDGINVDVEALPPELVLEYGQFVGRLRSALRATMPAAQVSVATQANEVGAAMAAAAAAAGADRIFLMGYDYRVAGSQPGASAPIDRLDGEPKDLVWSLDLYGALGVPVERTILGLPLYGVTWPVIGPGFGSPARGRGDAWVPRRNLGVFSDPSFEPTFEPTESVEFYAVPVDPPAPAPADPSPGASGPTDWNAVYYDSPRSLAPKLALADARGLAGAGFWAIGYERGLPGYGELIATFRAGKLGSAGAG